MNTVFAPLIAILCSAVLALPPGWCSSLRLHEVADSPVAAGSCCAGKTKTLPPSSDSQESPTEPQVRCCCSREATLPEKAFGLLDLTLGTWPVAVAAVLDISGPWETGHEVFAPFPSDPPLNILHCVWLC
jgi:hypothetical protein